MRQTSLGHAEALIVAGVVAGIVSLVVVIPGPESGIVRAVATHSVLETAASMVAALAAVLVAWRFLRGGQSAELLLTCGFAVLAVVDLVRALVPEVLGGASSGTVAWFSVVGSVLGLGLFVAAAFATRTVIDRRRRTLGVGLVAALGVLVVCGVLAVALSGALPRVAAYRLTDGSVRIERSDADVVVAVVQFALAGLLAFAGMAFLRAARRMGDELLGWLAVAAVLAAISRVHFAIVPTFSSELFFAGDGFRLAFYIVVLAGALREIAAYQSGLRAAAVLEERRRLAHELHDGLAQELAFIGAQVATLRERGDDRPEMGELALAAGRALDESRLAVTALSRPAEEPLGDAVVHLAQRLTAPSGAELVLDVPPDLDAEPLVRDTILRVLAEAVRNAVQHGRPSCLAIRLQRSAGLRLAVIDDGEGFDPAAPVNGGRYGLRIMRERAEALGGHLRLNSIPGTGTSVEVLLPPITPDPRGSR